MYVCVELQSFADDDEDETESEDERSGCNSICIIIPPL